jgi:hypothetical protein
VRTVAEDRAPPLSHLIMMQVKFLRGDPKEIDNIFLDVAQGAAEIELLPDTGEVVAKAMRIGGRKDC